MRIVQPFADDARSVTLRFQLTKAEFVRGCQRGYARAPIALVVVPGLVAVLLVYAAHLHARGSEGWIPLSVFALAWWPFFYLVLPGITFTRKGTAGELRTTTFGAAGSHHEGQTYTFDRPWRAYRSCLEFADMYVLRYQFGNSTTIPKRAFASAADELLFTAIVSSHVPCHGPPGHGRRGETPASSP